MRIPPIKSFLPFLLCLFFSIHLAAQLPESEVWLFSFTEQSGNYTFTDGKNISNHKGYDNQPFFSNDGLWMLFTSEQDSGQTDIFQYNIKLGQSNKFTNSSESEYSPEYFSTDNSFSDVVVEKDSTQRLWKYSYHPDYAYPQSTILFPDVKNVAYSRWFNDSIVFLCLLPEPMHLVVANVNTQKVSKCAKDVNRSMAVYHRNNNNNLFLYSQMQVDSTWEIAALSSFGNPDLDFMPVPFLEGSQDFAVDNNDNLFMASGTKLYFWKIGKSKTWKPIADFKENGLTNISRIAISPDGKHIALTDNLK
ncbi:hypothetical protein BH09BAC5_BH09BAC5_24170 [soil metagenome]